MFLRKGSSKFSDLNKNSDHSDGLSAAEKEVTVRQLLYWIKGKSNLLTTFPSFDSVLTNIFYDQDNDPLPFTYFAVFDGHAGAGAALMAVNMLHIIIQVRTFVFTHPFVLLGKRLVKHIDQYVNLDLTSTDNAAFDTC